MKVSAPFVFKQFAIRQQHAAFKVGTDSVLLGSWVNIPPNANTIVDVGTGTGILALMMAQRCASAFIHAVEIDPLSAKDAQYNFEASLWNERLNLHNTDFIRFASQHHIQVDLLITNPPYFNQSLKNKDNRTSKARHDDSLSFQALWKAALQILHMQATFALILPVQEMEKFAALGQRYGWYMYRSCRVSSFKHSLPIRIMAEFRQGQPSQPDITDMYLYQTEGKRSVMYEMLTQDFYL